ncbi:hypothetical protein C2G38_2080211, partial [Gigaspora rosea]
LSSPSLQIFDNKRMTYFHPFQLQFLFHNNIQHYLFHLRSPFLRLVCIGIIMNYYKNFIAKLIYYSMVKVGMVCIGILLFLSQKIPVAHCSGLN